MTDGLKTAVVVVFAVFLLVGAVGIFLVQVVGSFLISDCERLCEPNGGLADVRRVFMSQTSIHQECYCKDGVTHEVSSYTWFLDLLSSDD
jgi:hypothetical protein